MYCKYCGKEAAQDSLFCKSCGEKIGVIQNPTENISTYAGFANRLVAYLVDGIAVYLISFVIGFMIGFIVGFFQLSDALNSGGMDLFYKLLGIIITWLYYALMESSMKQETLGKMVMKIKVTDLDGNRISFARATGRYFAKMLSYMTMFAGFFFALFTEKKQTLHDMIAGTIVVTE